MRFVKIMLPPEKESYIFHLQPTDVRERAAMKFLWLPRFVATIDQDGCLKLEIRWLERTRMLESVDNLGRIRTIKFYELAQYKFRKCGPMPAR